MTAVLDHSYDQGQEMPLLLRWTEILPLDLAITQRHPHLHKLLHVKVEQQTRLEVLQEVVMLHRTCRQVMQLHLQLIQNVARAVDDRNLDRFIGDFGQGRPDFCGVLLGGLSRGRGTIHILSCFSKSLEWIWMEKSSGISILRRWKV